MIELFAITMTCTPPPPYFFTPYVDGTLEYCTVCSANSLVAGPGSGMVSIPVIVLFSCLSLIPDFFSDPEFYVSSYYSGCSHEKTRDMLAGDVRVADSEASRRLPRMIYSYSPCVVIGIYFGH